MKNLILLLTGLLLLNFGILNSNDKTEHKAALQGSISVFSTSDISSLTSMWAEEFCRFNPFVEINVLSVSELTLDESFNADGNLGFISNDYYSELGDESFWKTIVGRDVVVPIINSKNPFLDEINSFLFSTFIPLIDI